jgi:hypothetical protein
MIYTSKLRLINEADTGLSAFSKWPLRTSKCVQLGPPTQVSIDWYPIGYRLDSFLRSLDFFDFPRSLYRSFANFFALLRPSSGWPDLHRPFAIFIFARFPQFFPRLSPTFIEPLFNLFQSFPIFVGVLRLSNSPNCYDLCDALGPFFQKVRVNNQKVLLDLLSRESFRQVTRGVCVNLTMIRITNWEWTHEKSVNDIKT